jgi:hypothetical protein
MGTTPVYHWPYPELNNPPDGATQMKNLALAIEPTVKTNADNVAANTASITTIKAPPLCVVYQTTNLQNLPNGANTPVTFEAEVVDTAGMHDPVTNNTRITCKVTGWYRCTGAVRFAGNATGRRGTNWYVNGVAGEPTGLVIAAGTASSIAVPAADMLFRLVVNDYVELAAYQDSGAAITLSSNVNTRSFACVAFVCP